jgi:chemotaxis response regulator CheB
MKKTQVVLLQRQPLLGEALLRIFQGIENLELCYVDAADPQQINNCLEHIQPDIVVLAGEKEDDAATHLISNLLKHYEDIPILWVDLETNILRVYTSHSLTANSTELIRAIRSSKQNAMEIHLMEKKTSKDQRR